MNLWKFSVIDSVFYIIIVSIPSQYFWFVCLLVHSCSFIRLSVYGSCLLIYHFCLLVYWLFACLLVLFTCYWFCLLVYWFCLLGIGLVYLFIGFVYLFIDFVPCLLVYWFCLLVYWFCALFIGFVCWWGCQQSLRKIHRPWESVLQPGITTGSNINPQACFFFKQPGLKTELNWKIKCNLSGLCVILCYTLPCNCLYSQTAFSLKPAQFFGLFICLFACLLLSLHIYFFACLLFIVFVYLFLFTCLLKRLSTVAQKDTQTLEVCFAGITTWSSINPQTCFLFVSNDQARWQS